MPKEVDDLVDPLGADLDALAVAAEPVIPAQTAATVTTKSTPHKAPGDFAAAAAARFVLHIVALCSLMCPVTLHFRQKKKRR